MSNEKMKKTAIRINKILSSVLLLFLFIIPVVFILKVLGIGMLTEKELVLISVVILLLSVVPGVLNKLLYNEEFISMTILLSLELLFMIISLNRFVELSIIYVLVPAISLLYCNQKITQRISLLCYLGMIGVGIYRTYQMEDCNSSVYCSDVIYLTLLKFTVEFVLFAIVVSYISGRMEGENLGRENYNIHGQRQENLSASGKESSLAPVALLEENYDVEGLFCGIERDMQAIIKGKDKKFELELDSHLPVKLFGDKEEIRQAVSGICSDLLMYRPKAAVNLYVTYDSGIVPKNKQKLTLIIRISAYTDIAAITANKTALGYYLSRRVIEKLHGSFEDLSNSEEAVFKIRLLQRVEDEITLEGRKAKQIKELNQLKGESLRHINESLFKKNVRVLVVDDNKEVCKLIDAVLSSMGVWTDCTDNGAKAIQMLDGKQYQMVFIDQMMPEKSGVETVKELRYLEDEYYQKLPIILMTVNIREDAKKEYQDIGFSDCISKPIMVNEVKEKLRKWIKDDYPLTYAEYKKMQENENEI